MTSWFQDAIIYQIFIDRFSRGKLEDEKPLNCKAPSFCGGNLTGVIERLDYLKDLGINTIWLSPFNVTSEYHGYHITDFFAVDHRFGSLSILKKLIDEAHRRKIKILMDFVPNHMSSFHPYFLDAQKNKDSQYRNWFHFTKWPDQYLCFLKVRELPKINLDFEPARDHIVNSAKYWLSQGIDGFRLDHVVGPKHLFWKFFRSEIKKEYPEAVLIGEAWISGVKFADLRTIQIKGKIIKWLSGSISDALLKEYIGELDGVLDFEFQKLMKQYIAKPSFFRPRWLLQWKLKRHYKKYPADYFLPTFLDNHDMNRFLFETGQDKNKLKEAAKIQFAQKQPPIIYYGAEVGATQESDISSFKEHGDITARAMMNWSEDEQDNELYLFYKELILQRRSQRIKN